VIFITAATCAACGQSLRVQEDRRSQYPATGDLFVDLSDLANPVFSANCKNIQECNRYRAEHAVPS